MNEALAISLCESGGLHSHENHVRAYQRVRVCGRQGACHMYERISSGELGRFMHLLVDNLLPFSGWGRTVEKGSSNKDAERYYQVAPGKFQDPN